LSLLIAASMFAGCDGDGVAAPPEEEWKGPGVPISVNSRNLYFGGSLFGLAMVMTPADIPPAAGMTWKSVQQSKFPERAGVLAAEILAAAPDVVALQEVALFRTQMPGDWQSGAPPNATDVAFDFLELLLGEIRARGGDYRTVSVVLNADAELPVLMEDGTALDVRLTDRDAIIARAGIDAVDAGTGRFAIAVDVPIAGEGGLMLRLDRGYASADVSGPGGAKVRVVSTHLEVGGLLAYIQEQQARELLAAFSSYQGALIFAGDFNSAADGSSTASYSLLTTKAGTPSPFKDAWSVVPSGDLGRTCCVDLADPASRPESRIDLVLYRGKVLARSAKVVGLDPPGITASNLWASDHLGVQASLEFQ
jgi:endonuclease/exonuclease/phosphatase family metal-dependent hydrolase